MRCANGHRLIRVHPQVGLLQAPQKHRGCLEQGFCSLKNTEWIPGAHTPSSPKYPQVPQSLSARWLSLATASIEFPCILQICWPLSRANAYFQLNVNIFSGSPGSVGFSSKEQPWAAESAYHASIRFFFCQIQGGCLLCLERTFWGLWVYPEI